MTDRELLELAAKAAGIDAEFHPEIGYSPEGMWLKGSRSPDNSKYWNPLVSDGDALRLAVKLRITIQWSATVDDFSPSVEVYHAEDVHSECIEVKTGPSPYAATRRAIVRAAAEIGKEPPPEGRG